MTWPRALLVFLVLAAVGALTLPAQQPGKSNPPLPLADDEPLLFNTAAVTISTSGLRGWACAVGPGGQTFATCAGTGEQAGEILIWDLIEGKVRQTISHAKGIRSVAFLPDGRTLAAGCYGGELRLYDVATGELRASGTAHTGGVNGVAVTANGKRLITAGLDKTVKVWQLPALVAGKPAELKPYASLEEHTNRVFSVAVSKDGKTIVSGGEDNTARVWDMPEPAADGKPVVVKKSRRTLTGHARAVESVAITPDGRTAVTGSWDATVRLWDLDTGSVERSVFSGSGYGVLSVAVTPDGLNYVIASGNSGSNTPGEVRQFSLDDNTGGTPLVFVPNTAMRCVTLTPDGNIVVSIDENRVVRIKSLNEGDQPRELKPPTNTLQSSQVVLAVAWSRDGKDLAVAGENGSVTLYDTVTKQSRAWAAHDAAISALAFSPDGRRLASASHDGMVKLWDVEAWRAGSVSDRSFWVIKTPVASASGSPPVKVLSGHSNWVFCVAYSHDGKRVVSGGYDKTVRIWDAEGAAPPVVIKGGEAHSAGVRAVLFLPGDETVVSTGADRTIRFWDAKTGKERGLVRAHKGVIRALALAPDGKTLASGSEDQTVKLWELKREANGSYTATEKRELTGHGDMVASLAFSPKGRTLAAGTWTGGIHLWDPTTGRQRTVMRYSQQAIGAIAFAPNGASLAAGGYDRAARIWAASSLPASNALVSYLPHDQAITAVALSHDGQWTATGDQNGTLRIFERSGKLKLSASAHVGGVTALAALPTGGFVSVGRDKKIQFWDPQSNGPGNPARQMALNADTPLCLACSPKAPLIAVSGEGKTIQIIDAQLLIPVKQLTGHTAAVRALAFSPDGTRLASAGSDHTWRLWDTKTWAVKHQSPSGPNNGEFYAAAFSPDGNTLALAHNQEQVITPDGQLEQQQFRQVMLVDAVTGQPRSNQQIAFNHNDYVTGVVFSPDGSTLITASRDMIVRFWSLATNQVVRQIPAHRAGINAIAIDPSSGQFVTAGDDRLAALWSARFRQDGPRTTIGSSGGQVWFAEFSSDGTMLATGGDDKIVRIHKGVSGTQPLSFEQPSRACFSVASSPDGRFIATGHADGLIQLWDQTTGKRVRGLKAHKDPVWSLVFLDGGKKLVSSAGNWNRRAEQPGEATLWDVDKPGVIRSFGGQAGTIYVAMPSPDGQTLATGSHDGTIRLWEIETGKLKHTMTPGTPVRTLAFLPDGATLISAGHEDPNFIFWDVATGKEKARHKLPDDNAHVNRLRVSPDGKTLALVTNVEPPAINGPIAAPAVEELTGRMIRAATPQQTGTLLLWDLATNKVRAKSANANRMLDGEFSPDGGTFVTVGGVYAQSGEVKVWGTGMARYLGDLHGHKRWLEAVTFTKDGRLITGGGIDQPVQRGGGTRAIPVGVTAPPSQEMEPGELRAWSLAGLYPQHELKGHSAGATCGAFQPNGTLFATGSADKTVVVWDLAPTRKGLLPDKRTLNHEQQLRYVRFSPDGKILAAADEGGRVRLWDPLTGQLLREIAAHPLPAYGLTFSKDGRTLVTCAGNWRDKTHGEVKFWDVATGKQTGELPRQEQAVWCVAFSPNNDLLATACNDGLVRVYEMKGKTLTRTLRLGVSVRHLAFSPDGLLLSAAPNADNDTAIRLWEVATGQERATLQGHAAMTFTVRFSPDGKTLATCSKDRTAKLWDVPPGPPARTAKN
jgi:WD40 repeat protein